MKSKPMYHAKLLRLTPRLSVISVFVVILLLCLPPMSVFAGEDYITTLLRTDRESIEKASQLRHWVRSEQLTSSNLAQVRAYFNVVTNDYKYVWFGIITDSIGVRWFFSTSPASATCLRGTLTWGGAACIGNYGDLTALNQYTRVELRVENGNWVGKVIYSPTGAAADVARTSKGNTTIITARAESQEAYNGSSDPQVVMNFYHSTPQYVKDGSWIDWPTTTSTSAHNRLFTAPAGICPNIYGAQQTSNVRIWRTRSFTGPGLLCWIDPQW